MNVQKKYKICLFQDISTHFVSIFNARSHMDALETEQEDILQNLYMFLFQCSFCVPLHVSATAD